MKLVNSYKDMNLGDYLLFNGSILCDDGRRLQRVIRILSVDENGFECNILKTNYKEIVGRQAAKFGFAWKIDKKGNTKSHPKLKYYVLSEKEAFAYLI